MSATFGNRVMFSTDTVGTVSLRVGNPLPGYQSPAMARITSGSTVGYTIVDNLTWEVGRGQAIAGTPWIITRDVVEDSSAAGALAQLSGNAIVYLTLTAGQMVTLPHEQDDTLDGGNF